jgi:ABC-type transport system substrate-binding protein
MGLLLSRGCFWFTESSLFGAGRPFFAGARAVFERFAEYQPRAGGPVGFTAGPKVAHFERVEWLTLDPFSASATLRRGEIDWWENPPRDLVDQVSGDPNITVVSHFATANGIMTFNHRYPPFDNPAIRRALLGTVDQAEAMSAIAGSDLNIWRDDAGLFGTGSSLASDVGIEVLRSPRDYAAVKRALAEAGYKGEKIVVMAPTDVSELGNLTRTGAEQLRRAGMNVDLQEMDFANIVRRRNNQGTPDKGGYNMFCTLIDRSLPNVHPYGNLTRAPLSKNAMAPGTPMSLGSKPQPPPSSPTICCFPPTRPHMLKLQRNAIGSNKRQPQRASLDMALSEGD